MHAVVKIAARIAGATAALLAAPRFDAFAADGAAPNIVLILTDDLGYGDVGCYGATKVKTPNIDRLAREGALFTDAHSPAAVCTPTRYALLTGREWWRRGDRWCGEFLLNEAKMTLPALLKSAGYATGCVGKWHLGFGEKEPDWNGALRPGPLEAGFDSYFGPPRAHSEPPQVFVENDRVLGLDPADPIHVLPPDKLHAFGVMQGGKAARYNPEDIGIIQTGKAVSFIERSARGPFFLYFATCNVHVPITPNARFKGTSECGLYGDFIHELDWSVGEVLGALDRLGLAEKTLVIFTSDNGAAYNRDAVASGHRANGALLGQKCDAWEGGHRVPFVARWPGRIKGGTRRDDLVSLSDMIATTAAILGKELPAGAAPDSFNIVPALVDQPRRKPPRPYMTITSTRGLALREGRWLFYPKQGSGGFSADPQDKLWVKFWMLGFKNSDYTEDGTLKPGAPPGQLYDLDLDPRESKNLYSNQPEVVARLGALLERLEREARGK